MGFQVIAYWAMMAARALLTNPIVLAITAIALAALLIYKYWQPIKDIWDKWVTQPLSRLIEWCANLGTKFMTIGGQIIDGLWQGISAKWESVKAKVAEIGDSISSTVKEKIRHQIPFSCLCRNWFAHNGWT